MSKSHLSCSGCETSKGFIETLMADPSPEPSKSLSGEGGRMGEEGMKCAVTCEKTEWLDGGWTSSAKLTRTEGVGGAKAKDVILKTNVKKSSLLITGVRDYVFFFFPCDRWQHSGCLASLVPGHQMPVASLQMICSFLLQYTFLRVLLALGKILM